MDLDGKLANQQAVIFYWLDGNKRERLVILKGCVFVANQLSKYRTEGTCDLMAASV